MAVLIPTSSPKVLTRAPPELPGLTAASVCIKLSIALCSSIMLISRPFAEIIPAVTVEVRLNGLPTASTHWPNLTSSEFATSTFVSAFPSIFNKAISVVGSVPINSASYSSLFEVVTTIFFAPLIT